VSVDTATSSQTQTGEHLTVIGNAIPIDTVSANERVVDGPSTSSSDNDDKAIVHDRMPRLGFAFIEAAPEHTTVTADKVLTADEQALLKGTNIVKIARSAIPWHQKQARLVQLISAQAKRRTKNVRRQIRLEKIALRRAFRTHKSVNYRRLRLKLSGTSKVLKSQAKAKFPDSPRDQRKYYYSEWKKAQRQTKAQVRAWQRAANKFIARHVLDRKALYRYPNDAKKRADMIANVVKRRLARAEAKKQARAAHADAKKKARQQFVDAAAKKFPGSHRKPQRVRYIRASMRQWTRRQRRNKRNARKVARRQRKIRNMKKRIDRLALRRYPKNKTKRDAFAASLKKKLDNRIKKRSDRVKKRRKKHRRRRRRNTRRMKQAVILLKAKAKKLFPKSTRKQARWVAAQVRNIKRAYKKQQKRRRRKHRRRKLRTRQKLNRARRALVKAAQKKFPKNKAQQIKYVRTMMRKVKRAIRNNRSRRRRKRARQRKSMQRAVRLLQQKAQKKFPKSVAKQKQWVARMVRKIKQNRRRKKRGRKRRRRQSRKARIMNKLRKRARQKFPKDAAKQKSWIRSVVKKIKAARRRKRGRKKRRGKKPRRKRRKSRKRGKKVARFSRSWWRMVKRRVRIDARKKYDDKAMQETYYRDTLSKLKTLARKAKEKAAKRRRDRLAAKNARIDKNWARRSKFWTEKRFAAKKVLQDKIAAVRQQLHQALNDAKKVYDQNIVSAFLVRRRHAVNKQRVAAGMKPLPALTKDDVAKALGTKPWTREVQQQTLQQANNDASLLEEDV
jgi:hypothetical protein